MVWVDGVVLNNTAHDEDGPANLDSVRGIPAGALQFGDERWLIHSTRRLLSRHQNGSQSSSCSTSRQWSMVERAETNSPG